MDTLFLLLFGGLSYILVFGGLLVLRHEVLSIRFALETLILIALVGCLSFLTGAAVHPLLFFGLLFLVTLRIRLLVDLGGFLSDRGHLQAAERIYRLASYLAPDPAGQLSIRLHQGCARLQLGFLEEAIEIFDSILLPGRGFKGTSFEAACHYNLGLAYQRKGMGMLAIREFKLILDTWPVSKYADNASAALSHQAQEMLESQF